MTRQNLPSSSPRTPDAAADLIATLGPMSTRQKFIVAVLALISAAGLVAYIHQLRIGLAATAMNNYFSWGIYIVNFVFFIGISMAGTLISAMLRLTHANWRQPITRLAEAITLFALLIAGPMIIIDMGRPDRFLHVILYGRLQSPILWDVLSLTTYLTGSILYLYLPMIPDMAILRDCGQFSPWRRKMYGLLAMGWKGNPQQHHRLERAISVMAIAILPVAVSIHTVTAWLFGMTLRPGWHTTIIGPDFVVGALYSGVAAVITAIVLFRHHFKLYAYITADHLLKLSRLLVVFGFVYAYFIINEHVGDIYTDEGLQRPLSALIFQGRYAMEFWSMVGIGLVAPLFMLLTPLSRTTGGLAIASILVNVGMWLKRYIIVVPTLASPFMPPAEAAKLVYVPTLVEWTITAGAFAGFILLYMIFAKIFPIVSIWEVQEQEHPAPVSSSPVAIPAGAPA